MRALNRGRLLFRLAFGVFAIVLAIAISFLMRNPMAPGSVLSRVWLWLNSPALILAGWLSRGRTADAIAAYGTFPLQWFLIGVAVSFMFLHKRHESKHA